jgi:membrane protein YdbS with pleckstrin-like domain
MPTIFKTNTDLNRAKAKDTNADTTNPDDHLFISHVTIYRSGVILATYLIALELIFLLINLIIRVPLGFLSTNINSNILSTINTFLYLGLVIIKLILMVIIIFQWLENYYEIRPGKVIYKKGFFNRQEKEFDCPDIFKLDLSQGFWGRLFNFGSITLYIKPTKVSFSLTNIPNPHKNLKLLEKSLAHKKVEITLAEDLHEDDN